MNKSNLINEIMREYDKDRAASSGLKAKRISEIYERVPEIREIDDSLSNLNIELCRAILSKATEAEIKQMAHENQRKQERRIELLEAAGFGPDYLRDIHKCTKCFDTGSAPDGSKCACFKQKLISKYYQMSNLSRVLKHENFENFNFDYYSCSVHKNLGVSPREMTELIYRHAKQFVEEFGKKPNNLFFHGKPGLGKTFLCNCIAKEILDMGHTVLYAPATKLFKTIEDARFHRDEMTAPGEQIDFFYSTKLLIIDDLGTEFSTLATQSALFDIVNSRILDGRATIISSNLSPKDLEVQYSDRLVSRILEHYTFCHFIGEDIRQKKKYM